MGLDLIYSREHLSNHFIGENTLKFHFVQISFILNLNLNSLFWENNKRIKLHFKIPAWDKCKT